MINREVLSREKESELVLKAIEESKNINITGTDGTGKTWLLTKIKKQLPKDMVGINFSFSKLNALSKEEFIIKFTDAITEGFGIGKDWTRLSIIDLERELRKISITEAAKQKLRVLAGFSKEQSEEKIYGALFGLIDQLAADKRKRCVLLLDDLEIIDELKDENLVRALSNNISQSINVSLVVTSKRQMDQAGEIIQLKNEPLYDLMSKEELLDRLFLEKLNKLSGKERLILTAMAEHTANTPADISRIIDYSQTSIRRFLTIMEEKGFVTLKKRGWFEMNDPEFKRWIRKRNEK